MYARHGALKKHMHEIEGINSRLDGLQAAVLSVKLPYIVNWTENRIANAERYRKVLKGIDEISLPALRPNSKHSYHLFVIRAEKRDELAKFLKENGIGTAIHYPTALPNLKAYEYLNYSRSDFPVASAYENKILSLPMYPELSEEMINTVAEKIKLFYSNNNL